MPVHWLKNLLSFIVALNLMVLPLQAYANIVEVQNENGTSTSEKLMPCHQDVQSAGLDVYQPIVAVKKRCKMCGNDCPMNDCKSICRIIHVVIALPALFVGLTRIPNNTYQDAVTPMFHEVSLPGFRRPPRT